MTENFATGMLDSGALIAFQVDMRLSFCSLSKLTKNYLNLPAAKITAAIGRPILRDKSLTKWFTGTIRASPKAANQT